MDIFFTVSNIHKWFTNDNRGMWLTETASRISGDGYEKSKVDGDERLRAASVNGTVSYCMFFIDQTALPSSTAREPSLGKLEHKNGILSVFYGDSW